MKGEDVLAWPDVVDLNAHGHETVNNGAIVHGALTRYRIGQGLTFKRKQLMVFALTRCGLASIFGPWKARFRQERNGGWMSRLHDVDSLDGVNVSTAWEWASHSGSAGRPQVLRKAARSKFGLSAA